LSASGASFVGLLRRGDGLLTIAVNADEAVGLDPGRGTASAPAGDGKDANAVHDLGASIDHFVPDALEVTDRTLPARVLEIACRVEFRLCPSGTSS